MARKWRRLGEDWALSRPLRVAVRGRTGAVLGGGLVEVVVVVGRYFSPSSATLISLGGWLPEGRPCW